jgi:hypothetical protein
MRKILPQAYSGYSEDKILSITKRLGEKIILQEAQKVIFSLNGEVIPLFYWDHFACLRIS